MKTITNFSSPHLEKVVKTVSSMPMAQTLGLSFTHIAAGEVTLEMPVLESFTYIPGQLQATAVFSIADFAAFSAAGTLLKPGWINSGIDFTLKLLAPANGKLIRARGRVIQAGKLLTVCAADVVNVNEDGQETLCATLLGTARNIDMNTKPVADA
jgi:uncharacterized protein (TIGR00369 family)